MEDIKDKVDKIMENLDHSEPTFVDPVDEDREKESQERINAINQRFVPEKKKKNTKVLNSIKIIIWVLLVPFACEFLLTFALITIADVSISTRLIIGYGLSLFALHCIITLWTDWIIGRKRK